MKAFPLLIFPLLATPWIMAKDLPPTITLRDGRVLEGVTAMAIDAEKVKITHSGGISRHDPKSINPDSQKALGLEVTEQESAKMQKVTVIKTLDGTIYEGVRAVRIKPSFVSFVSQSLHGMVVSQMKSELDLGRKNWTRCRKSCVALRVSSRASVLR